MMGKSVSVGMHESSSANRSVLSLPGAGPTASMLPAPVMTKKRPFSRSSTRKGDFSGTGIGDAPRSHTPTPGASSPGLGKDKDADLPPLPRPSVEGNGNGDTIRGMLSQSHHQRPTFLKLNSASSIGGSGSDTNSPLEQERGPTSKLSGSLATNG